MNGRPRRTRGGSYDNTLFALIRPRSPMRTSRDGCDTIQLGGIENANLVAAGKAMMPRRTRRLRGPAHSLCRDPQVVCNIDARHGHPRRNAEPRIRHPSARRVEASSGTVQACSQPACVETRIVCRCDSRRWCVTLHKNLNCRSGSRRSKSFNASTGIRYSVAPVTVCAVLTN